MSSPQKKLFLIDAMALIYRAHFAFSKNPRITTSGINTSAVFGFCNSLLEVIQKEKPTHLGVAFDTPEPTFRHETFEAYKANRQEQPEDITVAIPLVKKLLECFQIPVVEMPGFEADDIIGTLSVKASAQDFHVFMMTMDKDYSQLVNEKVFLFKPSYLGSGYEILDVAKVLEKFKIKRVDQVKDILGLMGDAVDNIPGIPGIGEKTAQKLIEEFDTVENLVANSDKLKGKQRENVENYGAQGILSKQLATIHIDVPVSFDEDKFLFRGPLKEQMSQLCDELEFRTIKKRILGEEPVAAGTQTAAVAIGREGEQMALFGGSENSDGAESEVTEKVFDTVDTVPHDYYIVDTEEKRKELISFLVKQKEFCFDTETTGVDAYEDYIVGMSFSWEKGVGYYIPLPFPDFYKTQEILKEFSGVLENENITKIGQNLKFDILVLKKYEIEVKGPVFDTMIAHYLIDPDSRHNMDALSEAYLNYSPVSIETLIGKKGGKQKNMKDVPVAQIAEYAAEDADITYQLKGIFEPVLAKAQGVKLFTEVETPLIPVLADMEASGINLDVPVLKEYSKQLLEEIRVSERKIFEKVGQEFNIASPKQLGEILFEKLKLDPQAKKTKTGQYATGEEVLAKLAGEHEIARDILDFRELQKLKSTYVDALPELISKKDGRLHTSFNQTIAATGRLSSTNPNLQNIPVKTARGREIRKAFIPADKDHVILSADYSQVELRIMAAFSKEANMIEAFRNGRDIHATTASKVYKVELDQVTSEMRSKAKMVNFGIIYGISAFGLSQRLSIPRKEAGDIIDAYFREFPAIKTYMDTVINDAREHEYVETILGRRRYLRDINSRNMTIRGFAERNAINAPIQGSAADLIKVAMIRIHDWMKKNKMKSRMVLQVHDELVFDAHKEELNELKPAVEDFMKNAILMEVPMEVGIGLGNNWLEAH